MKKRLLLDIDGVFANFVDATLDTLVALGGPRKAHDDIHTWDMFSCLPPEWEKPLLAEWHKPGWCASIAPYVGAVDALPRLRAVAEVVFVTAAMPGAPHWMHEREIWVKNHLGGGVRDIVFAAAKNLVIGDFLVDDKTANVVEWQQAHPNGTALLWDQPYNRNDQVPDRVIRTRSWDRVLEVVSGA